MAEKDGSVHDGWLKRMVMRMMDGGRGWLCARRMVEEVFSA